jgi:hypothetical protein
MTWKNQSSGESKSIYGDEAAYKLPAGYSMQTGLWCANGRWRRARARSSLARRLDRDGFAACCGGAMWWLDQELNGCVPYLCTRPTRASARPPRPAFRQIPQQFECALTHLRELRPDSLLTIGTWSGWTDLFLNAYLSRFSRCGQ